jgi:hypothetical protein
LSDAPPVSNREVSALLAAAQLSAGATRQQSGVTIVPATLGVVAIQEP